MLVQTTEICSPKRISTMVPPAHIVIATVLLLPFILARWAVGWAVGNLNPIWRNRTTLEWQPTCSDAGLLDHIHITYCAQPCDGPSTNVSIPYDPDRPFHTFPELDPQLDYKFLIAGQTNRSTGSYYEVPQRPADAPGLSIVLVIVAVAAVMVVVYFAYVKVTKYRNSIIFFPVFEMKDLMDHRIYSLQDQRNEILDDRSSVTAAITDEPDNDEGLPNDTPPALPPARTEYQSWTIEFDPPTMPPALTENMEIAPPTMPPAPALTEYQSWHMEDFTQLAGVPFDADTDESDEPDVDEGLPYDTPPALLPSLTEYQSMNMEIAPPTMPAAPALTEFQSWHMEDLTQLAGVPFDADTDESDETTKFITPQPTENDVEDGRPSVQQELDRFDHGQTDGGEVTNSQQNQDT